MAPVPAAPTNAIAAVTFAADPGEIYFPARQVAKALAIPLQYDVALDLMTVGGRTLDPFSRKLSDGTYLISSKELKRLGVAFKGGSATWHGASAIYAAGKKRVLVDLKSQELWAWQGSLLVYRWDVSTGREGKQTPNGRFKADKKEDMHISSIYGSPMPFSVHLVGNIFIHGSTLIGSTPGSHGCIRLPIMTTRNVAEEFYNWIDLGTPVEVTGSFKFDQEPAKTGAGL